MKPKQSTEQDWGGKWTEVKLNSFIEYVRAYLTILNKYPHYKSIYFDGFAGLGEKITTKAKKTDLFNFEVNDSELTELHVYQGSAARVLKLEPPYQFAYYYFIETNEKSVDSLNLLRQSIDHIPRSQIIIRKEDCNSQLELLALALKKPNFTALILLDPFGMQINWSSISNLQGTHSDIWILIPSGVAINRLLGTSGELMALDRLTAFFGLSESEIRGIFYPPKEEETLFGTQKTNKKIDKPIDKIVEIYQRQLKTVWKNVSNPLILKNSKNNPIFHLIFASNNSTGLKIANYIIDKNSPKNI